MRFVIAIVAFVLSAVLLGVGFVQRAVLESSDHISASVTVPGDPHYILLNSSTMNAHPGQQTLSLSGNGNMSAAMVAYGRTADVLAWLGNEKYTRIDYTSAGSFTSTPVTTRSETYAQYYSNSHSTARPDPHGSDLWLNEYDGSAAKKVRLSIPAGMSVLVAANGSERAPNVVALRWPVGNNKVFTNIVITAGILFLVLGLALYIWGVYRHRRSGGPRRRGGQKMPRLPKTPKFKPVGALPPSGSRRHQVRHVTSGLVLAVAAVCAMSGETAAFADTSPTPTPTATSAVPITETMPPAVTVTQLQRIIARISATAQEADAQSNATLAATRFAGPALQEREANYTIRAKDSDQAMPIHISAKPIDVALPQATSSWPRVVMAVVSSPAASTGDSQAPVALALQQDNPRMNYHVLYCATLQPGAHVPDLAAATAGAAFVPPDSKLLSIAPNQLGAAYGDVLLHGTSSSWASKFDLTHDTLIPQVGAEWKQKTVEQFEQQYGNLTSLSWASQEGRGPVLSLATNDSGAIVWVNPEEIQTQKVTQAGAQATAGADVTALSGITTSTTGIESTFGYQLVFYVPPAGSSTQKVRLLGYAQGLIAASQIP